MGARGGRGGGGCAQLPARFESIEGAVRGVGGRGDSPMGEEEVAKWRRYGELVYEEDAPFETYT